MRKIIVLILLAAALTGLSVTAVSATEEVPPEPPPPTETTIAPDPGEDPSEESEGSVPVWLIVLVGFALIMIIAALMKGGSKPAPVQPKVTWKDLARAAFADTRWLGDALTEELAVWRGSPDAGDSGSALATNWSQIPSRMEAAKSNLYALEASAPDTNTAVRARTTVDALLALRAAVDERSAARTNYRAVEADASAPSEALVAARDREIRASTNLFRLRASLSEALNGLSTLR